MATITDIEVYLKRAVSASTSLSIVVEVWDEASVGSDPDSEELLGRKYVSTSTLGTDFSWITFQFDDPIPVPEGWYGIKIYVALADGTGADTLSQFVLTGFSFAASTAWDDVDGSPFTGQEKYFDKRDGWGNDWQDTFTRDTSYIINGEEAEAPVVLNQAISPDTAYTFGEVVAVGIRSRIEPSLYQVLLTAPDDAVEDTVIHFHVTWELDGRDIDTTFLYGDYFFLYLKKDSSDFTEDDLAAGWAQGSSIYVSQLDYGQLYYWQIQASNVAADMIDSEIRSFTTVDFNPPAPSIRQKGEGTVPTGENNMITVQRLVAAANGKFWYEDV